MRHDTGMDPKYTYFPRTTASQRRLLFETWEETRDVATACRKAHVCRQTFYNWQPRFAAASYAGLAACASSAPKVPHQTSAAVAVRVAELRRQHPSWGKQRIADELAQANNWVPVVAPNTVRRILRAAELWPVAAVVSLPAGPQSRTAEEPGQTVNVDLCFVPATHALARKLPAVSGSSGRLVIEAPVDPAARPTYPGRIFEDAALSYTEAMQAFVAASRLAVAERPALADASAAVPPPPGEPPLAGTSEAPTVPAAGTSVPPAAAPPSADAPPAATSIKTRTRAVRQTEAQLRDARRQTRARRQQEDAARADLRKQRYATLAARRAQSALERQQQRVAQDAEDETWHALRDQRRQQRDQREQEDEQWRQQRQSLRAALAQLPIVTLWIAILVLTDNCTRQCLGLPLFVTGAKVTAEIIVAALRVLLPPELQFLISDRGVHFTAKVFATLAAETDFIHVLIARHRPESNGIAERFVRTLKEWLAPHAWATAEELATLLAQFLAEYNERPHQGLAIPGLSPNEFAQRIWLL
jgi:transposase InsO family protein